MNTTPSSDSIEPFGTAIIGLFTSVETEVVGGMFILIEILFPTTGARSSVLRNLGYDTFGRWRALGSVILCHTGRNLEQQWHYSPDTSVGST